MIKSYSVLFSMAMAAVATAQSSVQISIGLRETGFAGGPAGNIGDDGGFSGGIEWVDLDGQTLTLDGTWQQFTFDLANDTITAFAGASADGVLDGMFGTLEHLRVRNNNGITAPIQLWIDDVADTITPGTTTFGDFEGYNQGDEVMFQEPDFSGSTDQNLMMGSTTGVDNFVASRTASDGFAFQFVDGTTTHWVRLTTFQATNQRNPIVRFDQSSVITFWMRGGKCQPNLFSNGPGTAIAEMCGPGLATRQISTHYTAGAPANAAGATLVSLPGGSDVTIFGGTLISFGNFVLDYPISADRGGLTAVTIPGTATSFDLVFQSVFLDMSLTENIAFTNAIQAEAGR